jgi:hypothetical protein
VKLQYDKKYNYLFAKIKLLYKFNFIPNHIEWKVSSERISNREFK